MGSKLSPGLVRLLRAAGCTLVRQGKGSHEIWRSLLTQRHVTAPCNTVMAHTANDILKDAGLPEAF
ncbi:type II toxin-antitoxin system HicA family toxin [Methylobacterium sp. ID0610]|uniref:type II toxin-antitoxin system HicA family toxin n=1 Tax=Methylobacterium carpenticola TaxID=3344827 RepID=UPI0036D16D25